MTGPVLEIEAVDAFYGGSHVLHGLSLSVEEGEVVALLGRNGAGKTTTLRSVVGLVPRIVGEIRFRGGSLRELATYEIAARGIALVPEDRRIFPNLTVTENLLIARSREGRGWALDEVFRHFPKLADRQGYKGRLLSGGEQRMLALARAMMGGPSLLLLDEPSLGLMPILVQEVMKIVRAFKARGMSILLAEQNAAMALAVSDRAYVISDGRITFGGEARVLRDDPDLRRRLLGVAMAAGQE